MRIDPRFAAQAAAALGAGTPRAPAAAGRPAFRLAEGGARGATGPRSAAPLATLDAILTLQGEEDTGGRKRRLARHGQGLLDALDALKAALLSGEVSGSELSRLSGRLAAAAGPSGDPGLDDTIAAIELRARVELAKRGIA